MIYASNFELTGFRIVLPRERSAVASARKACPGIQSRKVEGNHFPSQLLNHGMESSGDGCLSSVQTGDPARARFKRIKTPKRRSPSATNMGPETLPKVAGNPQCHRILSKRASRQISGGPWTRPGTLRSHQGLQYLMTNSKVGPRSSWTKGDRTLVQLN